MGGYLRHKLLPSLPERTIVVIAAPPGRRSRRRSTADRESLVVDLELGPLSRQASLELLRSRGVEEPRIAAELVAWAEGSPLALVLGADAVGESRGWNPHNAIERPRMVQSLIRRLAEAEIDAAHLGALGVASTARVTTVELLRDVLPGEDPVDAFEWLASRSFTEPLGEGLTLHELVRKAVGADLRRRDSERERELRRLIADHLYERAIDGRPLLSIDLAHLVESEAIRLGYSWEGGGERSTICDPATCSGSSGCSRSGPRGVVSPVASVLRRRAAAGGGRARFTGPPGWLSVAVAHTTRRPSSTSIRCWDRGSSTHVAGRAASTRSCGALRSTSPVTPIPGSRPCWEWRVYCARGSTTRAWPTCRSTLTCPGALEFSAAMAAEHLRELDRELGGVTIECHVIDYGPGGLLGAQRDVVYTELGLAPPRPEAPRRGEEIGDEVVREALRNLQLPHRLAAGELASGEGTERRAASVRELLEDAADRAFGTTEDERLLREGADSRLLRSGAQPGGGRRRAPHESLVVLPAPEDRRRASGGVRPRRTRPETSPTPKWYCAGRSALVRFGPSGRAALHRGSSRRAQPDPREGVRAGPGSLATWTPVRRSMEIRSGSSTRGVTRQTAPPYPSSTARSSPRGDRRLSGRSDDRLPNRSEDPGRIASADLALLSS